jgi:hypothetical protein
MTLVDKSVSKDKIRKLYKNHCVVCLRSPVEVHEIIPRSQTKDWRKWYNRIPLCKKCHWLIHENGWMKVGDFLDEKRKERLNVYYGTSDDKEIWVKFFP